MGSPKVSLPTLMTLMMGLVVVTTLTRCIVQNVNVLTQMLELIFIKSLLESNEKRVFEFRNTPVFFKNH